MAERRKVARDGWDSPYWATLYHCHGLARNFAELDEWAKEEQRLAEEAESQPDEKP